MMRLNLESRCFVGMLCLLFFVPLASMGQTQLYVQNLHANNKMYDATVSATVAFDTVTGVAAGHDVTVNPTASFADAAVGDAKTVTVSFSLSGADAASYLAPNDTTLYADITPKTLIAFGQMAASSKVYNGDTLCPMILYGNISGLISGESVTHFVIASFADAAVGANKPVTLRFSLYGPDAANYAAPADQMVTASITPKQLFVDSIVLDSNKIYDGTDLVGIADSGTVVGRVVGDSVEVVTSARLLGSVAVGLHRQVVVEHQLTGPDSGNYFILSDSSHYVDVVQRQLAVTGSAVAASKVYDGLTACTMTDTGSLVNLVPGDSVTLSATAAYLSASADTVKPVVVTYAISGPDMDSYLPPVDDTLYAQISPKPLLSLSYLVASSKEYDGNDTCPVIFQGTLVGLIGNDSVSHQVVALFSDAQVGTAKPVAVDFVLSGPQMGNYIPPVSVAGSADIVARPLFVDNTVLDSTRVYDGTQLCQVLYAGDLTNRVEGDSVALAATALFADRWAGQDKPVAVSYSISGPDASNYIAPEDTTLYASVARKQLGISGLGVALSKVYDGVDSCSVTNPGVGVGIIADDTVTVVPTARYNNAAVGTAKPVTVSFSLTGVQAPNYLAPADTTFIADITPRQLFASGTEVFPAKTFDGNDTAIVTVYPLLQNVVSQDNMQVHLDVSVRYDNAEPGHGKTITAFYHIRGSKAGNYLAPADSVLTTQGAIILPTVFDTLSGDSPVYATAEGFCQADGAGLAVRLLQGEPVEYVLDFVDERFQDVTSWTPLNPDGTISFGIPADCPQGSYEVVVRLRDEALFVSDSVIAAFAVNFPSSYIVQVFDDVVSVDAHEGLFADGGYQWYHDGQPIEGAVKPYYQELGGLTGSYSVRVTLTTGEIRRICDRDDFTSTPPAPSLQVYPNPFVDCLTVRLDGFADATHVVTVFDTFGKVRHRATFDGSSCSLNLSALPRGAYFLNVDGQAVKVIK